MLYNLYSNLPMPMARVIRTATTSADKLTTLVLNKQKDYQYVHLYEAKGKTFNYVKTIKLEQTSPS